MCSAATRSPQRQAPWPFDRNTWLAVAGRRLLDEDDDELLGVPNVSRVSPSHELCTDSGRAGLASIQEQITKLQRLRALPRTGTLSVNREPSIRFHPRVCATPMGRLTE